MFTPEDELDVLDHELGGLRRQLWSHEQTPSWRITDEDAFLEKRARLISRLRDLERERAIAYQELLDGAEEWAA